MAIKVRIPTPLRRLTDGQGEVDATGKTIGEMLGDLEVRYPGIKERLCDESGNLRRFVNIYVNEEDIRISFPEDKIKEPIIYQIGHEFKVVTNVRRADVREKTGWVELELEGDSTEIEKAVESLRAKGVKVEPIERNIIE